MICFLCVYLNYYFIKRDLTIIKNSYDNNNDIISFKKAYNSTHVPYIHLTAIEGVSLETPLAVLVDTGTNGNFFNEEILAKFKPSYKNDIEYSDDVLSITGRAMLNQAVTFKFGIKDKTYEENFVLTKDTETYQLLTREYGIPVVGIIGSEFFKKYKFDINFNNLTIRIPK